MHVLTTRGGEIVVSSIAATFCTRDACPCVHDHIAVDGMHLVDTCTVADLDVHLDHIADKVNNYLITMNWGEAVDDTAEAAHDLAAAAAEAAAEWPAGTRLRFKYHRDTAAWEYTRI